MSYHDLRGFLTALEKKGLLKTVEACVDPKLEMTALSDRALKAQGPALLFQQPTGHHIPVLTNLFGTVERVAMALGRKNAQDLRELGELLAFLKEPVPPKGIKEAFKQLPIFKTLYDMQPKTVKKAPVQTCVINKEQVDLQALPIQTCWPEDVAPLITWGLVTTRSPVSSRQNLGIYRQQVLGKNKLIMRWLSHRGGALDYQAHVAKYPDKPFPVAVALGADPATTLAAVMPIPDSISEYTFAGLLRHNKTALVKCKTHDLLVPATAEMILEGYIYPGETALEGPFGDHTGYYNEAATFPVFTVECITHRQDPIYHSTYTGKPPDEPAILGEALNEIFVPLIQKQFPEIMDFYLPSEGCSYRFCVVTIKKQYKGHAKRVMMGVWSFLRQFMYTKFIVVTDDDINARDLKDVIWAMTTRMDPARDMVVIENTPIDYLDFASPVSGLGSKVGFDATHKWPGETTREWGRAITMTESVKKRVDALWAEIYSE